MEKETVSKPSDPKVASHFTTGIGPGVGVSLRDMQESVENLYGKPVEKTTTSSELATLRQPNIV